MLFGTRVAYRDIAGSANPRRATSAVLSVPVFRRRNVDYFNLHAPVGGVVSSTEIRQGPQRGGFRALRPVAGTWLIEGRVMNTASAVTGGSVASPKLANLHITSSSMTVEAWIPSAIEAISPLVDSLEAGFVSST